MIRDAVLDALNQACERVNDATVDVIGQGLNYGLSRARKRSSGPWSLAQLAAADHPYATRHSTPMLDPAMINAQRGDFRDSWGTSPTRDGGKITNDSPVADFLVGTPRPRSKMVLRPVDRAVADETEDWLQAHIEPDVQRRVT